MKVAHGVGAVSDVCERVADELPSRFPRIDGLPIDCAGTVLHQPPRLVNGDGTREAGGKRQFFLVEIPKGITIMVV